MGVAMTQIRAMVAADLEEVAALEMANQPSPWSERALRDELETENRTYLVAGDETIHGFAGLMVVGDEAHVTNLLVDPAHRGRGIGRRLMVALIEAALEQGARHLTLEVRTRNEAARRLYSRMGLAPVGVRPRYYGDDDALILWAHDIDRSEYLESIR